MTTKVNLPVIIAFVNEDSAGNFANTLRTIIPKIRFEQIGEEDFVFFTRRDQKYRDIMAGGEPEFVHMPDGTEPGTENAGTATVA